MRSVGIQSDRERAFPNNGGAHRKRPFAGTVVDCEGIGQDIKGFLMVYELLVKMVSFGMR